VDEPVRVSLPGGRWVDGSRVTEAWVRPLVGEDEAVLLDALGRITYPELTTRILVRCVTRLGRDPVGREMISALTIGDREALLWHVRRLTVGDLIEAVLSCASCGEKASIELTVVDLVRQPYAEWNPTFEEEIAGRRVEFRLPCGFDVERLSSSSHRDLELLADALVEACVIRVDGSPVVPGQLEPIRDRLSERLASLDPQAETLLDTTCPACDAPIAASLDAASFLAEELQRRSRYLFEEVHVLATAYHWSEREILGMTADRRRIYLDMIERASAGEWIGAAS
jgi:hypothetical protein